MATQEWDEWGSTLLAQNAVKPCNDDAAEHNLHDIEWAPKVLEAARVKHDLCELEAASELFRSKDASMQEMIFLFQSGLCLETHEELDIPRNKLQFGNFEEWLSGLEKHLDQLPHGLTPSPANPLSAHLERELPLHTVNDQNTTMRWERDDLKVSKCILGNVQSHVLSRQPLSNGNYLTACGILQQLKKGTHSFRFLDLPPELRDEIYDLCLVDREVLDATGNYGSEFASRGLLITRFRQWRVQRHIGNPALLNVSRQLHLEAGKIFYQRNVFNMYFEYRNVVEEIELWSRLFVRDLLSHLRELHVFADYDDSKEEFQSDLHVKFTSEHGLQASGTSSQFDMASQKYDEDVPPSVIEGLQEHVVKIEEERVLRGRTGEAVVDFFTRQTKHLQQMCFGIPRRQSDNEDCDHLIECDANDPWNESRRW